MDYQVTREDDRGRVIRAQFRYVGDALDFAKVKLAQEINPCLWTVKNTVTEMTVSRWRYLAGRIEKEV